MLEYEGTALTSTVLLQGEQEIGITFQIQLTVNISVGADVLLFLGGLVCGNWAKEVISQYVWEVICLDTTTKG